LAGSILGETAAKESHHIEPSFHDPRRQAAGPAPFLCTGKWRQVRQRTGEHCPSRFIPAGQLDELVWQDLCELLRHPSASCCVIPLRVAASSLCELLRHPESAAQSLRRARAGPWLPQELQARRENLRRDRASLEQQVERLTEAYLSGAMALPEYRRRRAELEPRRASLARPEEQLAQQAGRLNAGRLNEAAGLISSVEDFCRRVGEGLELARA